MKFNPTPLQGAYLIELEPRGDERGFFARCFCKNEFEAAGLESNFVQMNNSLSTRRGTLRGLHYQVPPAAEVKVVRCLRGSLYDFIVDLRPDSPTFTQWFGAELNENNRTMMYVPRGFAHAILTLSDNVEALYFVSAFYSPREERGFRYNDPYFNIRLPIEPVEISQKDRTWPDFDVHSSAVEPLRGFA